MEFQTDGRRGVWDEGLWLGMCVGSATLIVQGLKKECDRVESCKGKYIRGFGCCGPSKVVAARGFLEVVSKLGVVKKGTISVHCTARNVGRLSGSKGWRGCHSLHLHQASH